MKLDKKAFFKHRASRSAFFQLAGYGFQGINFIVNVKIANTLGVDDFSLYSSVIVWYSIITAFTTFGMYEFLITLFTGKLEEDVKILWAGVTFHTGFLIFIYLIIFLTQGYNSTNSEIKYLYILFPFVLVSGLSIIQTYHIFMLNGQFIAITQLTTIAICNILKIVVLVYSPELIYFILIFGLELMITAIIAIKLSPRTFRSGSIRIEGAKHFWPVGIIYLLISGLSVVGSKLDQISAASLNDASTTASYFASLRLIEVSLFIPTILNQAFLSVESLQIRKLFFNYYFASLFILCAIIFAFDERIYYLFFSEQFAESYLKSFLPYLILYWIGSYIRARALTKKNYSSILYCVISGFIAAFATMQLITFNPQTLPLLPTAYHIGFILAMLFFSGRGTKNV